ncbi:MAG: hypothetical protein ACI83P_000898 [Janthinobacterium sp.]
MAVFEKDIALLAKMTGARRCGVVFSAIFFFLQSAARGKVAISALQYQIQKNE